MASETNPYAEHRTATVSTRVTEDEYQELEALAEARGQKMSEWVREVLLNQRGEPAGHDVVLAEVMALRSIVLNLAATQAMGKTMSEERIRELVRLADVERFRRANEKWIEAANHFMGQDQSKTKSNSKPGKE
jgi:chorismate-pyruvate lyase